MVSSHQIRSQITFTRQPIGSGERVFRCGLWTIDFFFNSCIVHLVYQHVSFIWCNMFKVTTHESVPPISSKGRKTGLTAALRNLELNQSLHIPADKQDPTRQRSRILAITQYVGKGLFSVRVREDRSFDVYRVRKPE